MAMRVAMRRWRTYSKRLSPHRPGACRDDAVDSHEQAYFGCTTVIVAGVDLPTPRSCGRYMSSTSGGGTV